MAWNFCSSGAAINKAGKHANAGIVASSAILASWSLQAEHLINAETRRDWIASAASANTKQALGGAASALIANEIIGYDMSGYTTLAYAQTMMDKNENTARRAIAFLKDEEVKEKM